MAVRRFLFTGDVLFANAFKAGYDADGIKGVVAPELLEELRAADILMVNNEFPFSDRGTPMADKQFTFRCSPGYVKALNEMGVDVVSLANNHTLDYGREALSDTFAALDGAGILYGGAGDSAERAKQVQVIEVHGKKYGFIAVSRVVPTADWKVENAVPGLFSCYDTTALVEVIKEAKETCDYVAVYPHWGVGVPGISGGEPDTDCEGVHRCRGGCGCGIAHPLSAGGLLYRREAGILQSRQFYLRAEYRPVGDA